MKLFAISSFFVGDTKLDLYTISLRLLNTLRNVRPLLPSSGVSGDLSSLSSAGCVFHPTSSISESRSPSTDDTFHSATQQTWPCHHLGSNVARQGWRDEGRGRSPGAAAAPWCCLHTGRSILSSGSHVSAAEAASLSSAAFPPAGKTEGQQKWREKGKKMRARGRRLRASHLLDSLPLFGGADCWVDADALLKDGQTGLCLTALDLGQPALLLLLPRFQVLDHPLIVALHVFQLLRQQKIEVAMTFEAHLKSKRSASEETNLLMFLHKLVPLEEELVFQLLL